MRLPGMPILEVLPCWSRFKTTLAARTPPEPPIRATLQINTLSLSRESGG
jgi:hypothetical protein